MYTKAIISAILAGQVANAAILPRVVTVSSVITLTTYVPAPTSDIEAAGNNPSNVATPAPSAPEEAGTTVVSLASFIDESRSRASQSVSVPMPTVTITQTQTRNVPVLITVTSYECDPTDLNTAAPSLTTSAPIATSTASSASSSAKPSSSKLLKDDISTVPSSDSKPSSTAMPSSSVSTTWDFPYPDKTSSSEPTKSSKAPASSSSKACVFPIPGECDI